MSAPYEDSGRGAVYIYSGGHLLSDVADSMLRSLQRIQPEGYRSFGLSITALQDYDDNGCNGKIRKDTWQYAAESAANSAGGLPLVRP